MKDKFKVVNFFSGVEAGKSMYNSQMLCLRYLEKYLGKPIEIRMMDHEIIEELTNER